MLPFPLVPGAGPIPPAIQLWLDHPYAIPVASLNFSVMANSFKSFDRLTSYLLINWFTVTAGRHFQSRGGSFLGGGVNFP